MTPFEHAISMDMLYKCWQKISMKSTNVDARADGSAATGTAGAAGVAGVGTSVGIDGIDISLYRTDLHKNLRSLQAPECDCRSHVTGINNSTFWRNIDACAACWRKNDYIV